MTILLLISCNSDTNPSTDGDEPTTVKEDTQKEKEIEIKVDSTALARAQAVKDSIVQDSIQKVEEALALEEKAKKEAAAKKAAEEKKKKQLEAQKNAPKIKFDQTTYDFGEIKEGDVVKYEFFFTNTGKSDLVIKDASATCGCTVPGFSFLPIKPGDTSAINVSFNSAHKVGPQKPVITVITNGYPSKQILTMTGTVVTK